MPDTRCYPARYRTVLACSTLAAAILVQPAMPGDPIAPTRPADYELSWEAPASCPDADAIRAKVEAWLDGRDGGEGTMHVTAHASVVSDRWRMRVHTELAGATDTRDVEAASCVELTDTLALLVALAIEPPEATSAALPEPPTTRLEAVETPAPDPDPVVAAPAIPPTRVRAEPPRTTGTAPRRRPTPTLRLGAGVESGAVPGVSAMIVGATALHFDRWRMELTGSWLAPRERTAEGLRVRVQIGALGLRACALPELGRWQWPVCAGIEAGAMRLRGAGTVPARVVHGPWLAPVVAAGLGRRFGRWGLWLVAETAIRAVGTRAVTSRAIVTTTASTSLRLLGGMTLYLGR